MRALTWLSALLIGIFTLAGVATVIPASGRAGVITLFAGTALAAIVTASVVTTAESPFTGRA